MPSSRRRGRRGGPAAAWPALASKRNAVTTAALPGFRRAADLGEVVGRLRRQQVREDGLGEDEIGAPRPRPGIGSSSPARPRRAPYAEAISGEREGEAGIVRVAPAAPVDRGRVHVEPDVAAVRAEAARELRDHGSRAAADVHDACRPGATRPRPSRNSAVSRAALSKRATAPVWRRSQRGGRGSRPATRRHALSTGLAMRYASGPSAEKRVGRSRRARLPACGPPAASRRRTSRTGAAPGPSWPSGISSSSRGRRERSSSRRERPGRTRTPPCAARGPGRSRRAGRAAVRYAPTAMTAGRGQKRGSG